MPANGSEPDIFLSVPDVHVDDIRLDVENLQAHLALQARLANLVELRAGATVLIEKVDLEIKGVAAKALLKVRLENVLAILDRALTSIDRNPQILEDAIGVVDHAVGPDGIIEGVARSVGSTRRSRTVARLGTTVRRLSHGHNRLPTPAKIATAAGLVGGAALAAHGNGGIEKTLKQLTS